jgi:antitoxin component YwqK of YwqJK toxin-antitoxin module
MKKIFTYCFDKWWRPILFSLVSNCYCLFIYSLGLRYEWYHNGIWGITSSSVIAISVLGLIFSIFYQLIKKHWLKGLLTLLFLVASILSLMYVINYLDDYSENKKVLKKYPSGKIKQEIIYHSPSDTLYYALVSYYENGQIKSSADFYDGRYHGRMIDYYENGNTKFVGTTTMGFFTGIKYCYSKDGKISQTDSLLRICKVNNCNCDGIITQYYPNGKIHEIYTVKSDQIDGEAIFFNENGKIKMKRIYHLGSADGVTTEYYEEYNIHGQYVNGKEEGEWKYIDSLGNIKRVDVYKNGVLVKHGKKIKW